MRLYNASQLRWPVRYFLLENKAYIAILSSGIMPELVQPEFGRFGASCFEHGPHVLSPRTAYLFKSRRTWQ